MSTKRTVAVLPAFRVIRLPGDRVLMQERFMSGMKPYQDNWDGDVIAIIEPAPLQDLDSNIDRILAGQDREVAIKDLGFKLHIVDYFDPRMRQLLEDVDLILSSVSYRQNHLARIANDVGTALIYNSEYTLKTRFQIARSEEPDFSSFVRRSAWEMNNERAVRAGVRICQGLQANGLPTYHAYKDLAPSSMYYFDGRMTQDMLIPEDKRALRVQTMLQGGPLRLTWSGRMMKFKGADHLVEVAHHLRNLGVDFTMDLFGGGVLAEPMQARIDKLQLNDKVKLRGYVAFEKLTDENQNHFDVWVCPHPQGDPSSAYLETLGNGMPMLGYANEALTGVLSKVNAGRTAPIGDAAGLAKLIARYDRDRQQLARWSKVGLDFARHHTFDLTFRRRAEHFAEVLALRDASIG